MDKKLKHTAWTQIISPWLFCPLFFWFPLELIRFNTYQTIKCTELLFNPYFMSSYERTVAESSYPRPNQTCIVDNFVFNKAWNLSYPSLLNFNFFPLVMQLIIYTTRNADRCGKQGCLQPYRTLISVTIGGHNFIFLNYL